MSSENSDRYESIEDGPEIELKVKGSSFLGQAFASTRVEDVQEHLAPLRRRYYDANHHCWALRLGPPETPFERSEDDGEPRATGGPPQLGVLQSCNLYDALVVVTRYFGGTKLGTGGLARAYGEAARGALEAARPRTIWRLQRVGVQCAYEDLGTVESLLVRAAADIHDVAREFDPSPRFEISILRSRAEALCAQVIESTAGRARAQILPTGN